MNTTFNIRNNNRYLILLSIVSVFSTIVFLTSSESIQSVFATPQGPTKDQMKNMMGMQNQSRMMDQNQKQAMMKQMNKTSMMMGKTIFFELFNSLYIFLYFTINYLNSHGKNFAR